MSALERPVRVLVVGLGNMGRSHALAYHANPGFEIVGLANRSALDLPDALKAYPFFESYEAALAALNPDLVSINTYSESHADYAVAAMEAGAHVFVEKPLATTVLDAKRVVAKARETGRKLVIGYILRHHPSWQTLIEEARKMGGPYVFRLNLNQQSSGPTWKTHKNLMQTTSPIVDCGVHYVDVMCQIADSRPVSVRGMGLRLSGEVAADMYNYGHFQVLFEDGSLGWYEAGWGPMMSETAFFVKDIVSPRGSVSIIMDERARSDDINTHTRTSIIRIHHAATDADGRFTETDTELSMADEPDHQALCDREQAYVLRAIREDLDLTRHMDDAVQSLIICLAADASIRSGQVITL
jgi:predicted dehydrogenase